MSVHLNNFEAPLLFYPVGLDTNYPASNGILTFLSSSSVFFLASFFFFFRNFRAIVPDTEHERIFLFLFLSEPCVRVGLNEKKETSTLNILASWLWARTTQRQIGKRLAAHQLLSWLHRMHHLCDTTQVALDETAMCDSSTYGTNSMCSRI